jgi:hypothetical protein
MHGGHKFQTQTWTTGSRTQMRLPFSCRASMYLATTPSGVAPAGRSSCESNGLNSGLNFLCKRFCGRRAISV